MGGWAADAFADYQSMVATAWRRYQLELADCYGAVTRWPGSPFWTRRATLAGGGSLSGDPLGAQGAARQPPLSSGVVG